MNVPKKAKKATVAATGVAIATSGLTSCNGGGSVDPLPPALECNNVNAGQSLTATVTRNADTAQVTVRNIEPLTTWRVLALSNVVGGAIVNAQLPTDVVGSTLVLTIKLAAAAPTQVSFALTAEMRSTIESGPPCGVSRTITVTVTATTADVVIRGADPLPLPARQRAEIVLVARDGRTVELTARTPYRGEYQAQWTVTAGDIVADGSRLWWTLPEARGLYQAELVMDYGADGFAIDAMPFEVI